MTNVVVARYHCTFVRRSGDRSHYFDNHDRVEISGQLLDLRGFGIFKHANGSSSADLLRIGLSVEDAVFLMLTGIGEIT